MMANPNFIWCPRRGGSKASAAFGRDRKTARGSISCRASHILCHISFLFTFPLGDGFPSFSSSSYQLPSNCWSGLGVWWLRRVSYPLQEPGVQSPNRPKTGALGPRGCQNLGQSDGHAPRMAVLRGFPPQKDALKMYHFKMYVRVCPAGGGKSWVCPADCGKKVSPALCLVFGEP